MDISAATTPLAALAVGFITSLHCAGMCGPLTCAMFGGCKKNGTRSAAASYQIARLATYSLLGGVLGAIGGSAASIFTSNPVKLMPWAFAAVFVMLALGLDKRIPQPKFAAPLFLKLRLVAPQPKFRGALLGLVTPLLPCGPLYLMLGIALVTGSFFDGARLMAAFALGTLPLYALAQLGWMRVAASISPRRLQWTRQAVALVSALLLVWRASAGTTIANAVCALCH